MGVGCTYSQSVSERSNPNRRTAIERLPVEQRNGFATLGTIGENESTHQTAAVLGLPGCAEVIVSGHCLAHMASRLGSQGVTILEGTVIMLMPSYSEVNSSCRENHGTFAMEGGRRPRSQNGDEMGWT